MDLHKKSLPLLFQAIVSLTIQQSEAVAYPEVSQLGKLRVQWFFPLLVLTLCLCYLMKLII